jgi:hypothetical protein
MESNQRISVIEPITPAIERVKLILFRPFDIAKWFTIGFCAWLAYLLQGGGGGGNYNPGHSGRPDFHSVFHEHLALVIGIGIVVAVIIIAVTVVCLWLSSRGKFMFLHCVATNKAEVSVPWRAYKMHGNSLFIFRLIAGIISILLVAIIAGAITAGGFAMYKNNAAMWMMIASLILISLLTVVPVMIVIAIFFKFTNDFVIPIMFLRGKTAVEAWREFGSMLSGNKGAFVLYILFQIVILIAIGAIVFAAILTACCFCCCTACVWFIPYINTVVLLPVLIFKLAYSLYYLRQFGPQFDVFTAAGAQSIS